MERKRLRGWREKGKIPRDTNVTWVDVLDPIRRVEYREFCCKRTQNS